MLVIATVMSLLFLFVSSLLDPPPSTKKNAHPPTNVCMQDPRSSKQQPPKPFLLPIGSRYYNRIKTLLIQEVSEATLTRAIETASLPRHRERRRPARQTGCP